MRIEVKEEGTREFYREVVNVLMQYKKLIKNPEAPLTDNFKSFRSICIAAAAVFAVNMICGFLFGWNNIIFICSAAMWVCVAMLLVYLNKMNKTVQAYLDDKRSSVVILDEKGVALSKDGSLAVRLPWEGVAFVRSFSESTCFVPKEELGIVISVFNSHKDEIREYMENNDTGVRTVFF